MLWSCPNFFIRNVNTIILPTLKFAECCRILSLFLSFSLSHTLTFYLGLRYFDKKLESVKKKLRTNLIRFLWRVLWFNAFFLFCFVGSVGTYTLCIINLISFHCIFYTTVLDRSIYFKFIFLSHKISWIIFSFEVHSRLNHLTNSKLSKKYYHRTLDFFSSFLSNLWEC